MEGDGRIGVGCCVITAGFATTGDSPWFGAKTVHSECKVAGDRGQIEQTWRCYLVRNGAFHKIAFRFCTRQ